MADENANPLRKDDLPLRDMSPRRIAALIRGLDSRLVGIESDDSGGRLVLVYRFDVAGRVESFPVLVRSPNQTSIVDLYPEAAARERELQEIFGLVFRQPESERVEE